MAVWQFDIPLIPRSEADVGVKLIAEMDSGAKSGEPAWWPDFRNSWQRSPLTLAQLEAGLKGCLDGSTKHDGFIRFGASEWTILQPLVQGQEIYELMMRVALIRGPLPPVQGFYERMEEGARKGFEVGQSVCQSLDLCGLLRQSDSPCTFGDWLSFREAIGSSNAWRFCESLWLAGSVPDED